tara:strand:+ start:185 stop:637 length:453 start_codon:yes stop_codon:yes gene_type:complete
MPKIPNTKFIFNWVLTNKIGIGTPLRSKEDVILLKKKKIKSILSLCSNTALDHNLHINFEQKTYQLPDHRSGSCPSINQIRQIIKIIEELIIEGPLFIHCEASVERSPLICIAWLVSKEGIPLEHAVSYLREVHPNSNPHFDQLEVLKNI